MPARTFDVPEPVRMRAESLGPAGASWLVELGALVQHLEHVWSIRVGRVLTGGSESLVAEATGTGGSPAILKVGLPGSANLAMEARVYGLAGGRGYARLHAHDKASNAILVERLGDPLARHEMSTDRQIAVICDTLCEAWIPLSETHGLMTGAEKARWLAEFITDRWERLDRPCDAATIRRALTFAEAREAAFSPETAVLVHGDAHSFNALSVPDEPGRYRFVDPDGLFAERACDLAVPLRDWNDELLRGDSRARARRRCDRLAELTGVDHAAIWQWGFVERVSTGLTLLEIGMTDEALTYLAVADRLAAEPV